MLNQTKNKTKMGTFLAVALGVIAGKWAWKKWFK